MADPRFPRIVSLACHDLRTPLATISGFAKTLVRQGQLGEQQQHFVDLIDAAAGEMAALLDQVSVLARIEGGTYEPARIEVDTFELALSSDPRVITGGVGETIVTDAVVVQRSLEALAVAAVRHGEISEVTWTVRGRELNLTPVNDAAAPVVLGEEIRDLGALIAGRVVDALGGWLALEGETLRVLLA
jgi:light-regulated signal transduction histidine kinase (bacteriophytochrome)